MQCTLPTRSSAQKHTTAPGLTITTGSQSSAKQADNQQRTYEKLREGPHTNTQLRLQAFVPSALDTGRAAVTAQVDICQRGAAAAADAKSLISIASPGKDDGPMGTRDAVPTSSDACAE